MVNYLKNKNILLGITGGIAAYKSAELVRQFRKLDANVKVVMTNSAKEFVSPLTFQTLSNNKVYHQLFDPDETFDVEHINLSRWADVLLITPATANIIAKITHGIADDLLSTVCLASKTKIALAPAMNQNMWSNIATQENIVQLKKRNIVIFGPGKGFQACGDTEIGRMLEPAEIVELTQRLFAKPLLKGLNVVVTAGSTYESIDPVRFIGNHSSGKMGFAIATAAVHAGAKVKLISGPTSQPAPLDVERISVVSAEEMFDAVKQNINHCDIFISTAAVADYKPTKISTQKIKKTAQNLILTLTQNPDILSYVSHLKNPPITIGFSAETKNLLKNAKKKLKVKKLDMIIATLVGKNLGFNQDQIEVSVCLKNGKTIPLPMEDKHNISQKIIEIAAIGARPLLQASNTSEQKRH